MQSHFRHVFNDSGSSIGELRVSFNEENVLGN